METTPTPQAIRAAENLMPGQFSAETGSYEVTEDTETIRQAVAKLIDTATGLPYLLMRLDGLEKRFERHNDDMGVHGKVRDSLSLAKELLHKQRGDYSPVIYRGFTLGHFDRIELETLVAMALAQRKELGSDLSFTDEP